MPSERDTARSIPGVVAAVAAFLLPVAYSPAVNAPFWSPKAAVLLVVGAFGLPLLPRLWRSPLGPAAIAVTAFLALACLATAFSPEPGNALVGLYNWGTGLVFLAALVGCWALGAHATSADRSLLLKALLAGAAVSGTVAVLQTLVSLGVPSLDPAGRVAGLSGNPVHLGGLMAATAGVAAWGARRSARWALAAALPAVVIQLTGTRFALVLLVVAAVGGAAAAGRRRGALLLVAVGVGLLLGNALASAGDVQTAVARSANDGSDSIATGGGSTVRLDVWTYALDALSERPVLGHGPGRFRAATSADRTLTVARFEGGDAIYSDAHNIVVELSVTVGIPAALAMLAWLGLVLRRARGPLAAFGATLLAMALVQPMSFSTTPLLFLALGAAAGPAASLSPKTKRLAPATLTLGVLAAGALVLGDIRLNQARLDFELRDARAADQLLRPWPEPATMIARIHTFRQLSRESTHDQAIRWREEAVRRDPTDPSLRIRLGDQLLYAEHAERARGQYRSALRLNPFSTSALERLALLAEERNDVEQAIGYLERAAEIRPSRVLDRQLARLRQNA